MSLKDTMNDLMRFEGFRAYAYRCPSGAMTIGYGRNIDDGAVTGLRGRGLSTVEAELLLVNDIRASQEAVRRLLARWDVPPLDDVRLDVLVQMAFQMGENSLGGFAKMWQALQAYAYSAAADEMLDSKWAKQDSPARAVELARRMRFGVR